MLTVARLFAEIGITCATTALGGTECDYKEAINGSAVTVLPLPYQKGGILNAPMSNDEIYIGDVFAAGNGKTLFVGGGAPPDSVPFADYSNREELLIKNAVLTAEGAIDIALRESDTSLFGASVTVIGYGRIGSRLALLLNAFGARVTVAARRSESRALAEALGCIAVGFDCISDALANADCIFNTVPYPTLSKEILSSIGDGVPLIELASEPGGIRKGEESYCKGKLINAPGLPGKIAPEAAGRIIFEAVTAIMRERGLLI